MIPMTSFASVSGSLSHRTFAVGLAQGHHSQAVPPGRVAIRAIAKSNGAIIGGRGAKTSCEGFLCRPRAQPSCGTFSRSPFKTNLREASVIARAAAAEFDKDASTTADDEEEWELAMDDGEQDNEALGMQEELAFEWDIKDRVSVNTGLGKMPRVILTHPSGSQAEVYLYGANVTSWQLPNKSEVLYMRPDRQVSYEEPFSGGIPICFPQFGPGNGSPGTLPRVPSMQQHGFARNCEWEVVATADDLGPTGKDVGVMLRLTDNEYTRSMWDFPFEARYEVLLMEKQLMCKLTIANPGEETFPFTCALHPYIGVLDALDPNVNVVGLQGKTFFDKADTPGKVRVRTLTENALLFGGKAVDGVFVDTPSQVGLNVGTGASVVVTNMEGFSDHIVWNPGKVGIRYGLWQNFACVESGRVARPIKLPPQHSWEGIMRLEVWDEEAIHMSVSDAYDPVFAKQNDNLDGEEEEEDEDAEF